MRSMCKAYARPCIASPKRLRNMRMMPAWEDTPYDVCSIYSGRSFKPTRGEDSTPVVMLW